MFVELRYTGKLPVESIVDIFAEVVAANVESATQNTVELSVKKIFAVSVSATRAPFSVHVSSASHSFVFIS